MTLTTGEVLQTRYRIVSPLGQGGFGAVYKGWDISLNKHIAIKENLDTSPEAQRQFHQEAQILGRLTHPNLPRVQDHFLLPGAGQYLVMDFIEGEDLQEMLNRLGQPLSVEQALPWLMQVCDALAYLHTQTPPIIHRDIKPANIKITPQGKAVLVDFGISKIYDPQLKTTIGARAVTPGYSPVEQYGQGTTDARSDIYALGATWYVLLTGQEPQESVQRTLEDRLQAPQQVNPHVMPGVGQVIQKALTVSPTGRYQSAQELGQALSTAAQQARQERLAALYQQATAAVGRNDFDDADLALRQLLAFEPNHTAALALSKQVAQQRTADQRYQALVAVVAQAKTEAGALQHFNPPLADPAGVLRLLSAKPAVVLSPITPAVPAAHSASLRNGALILLVLGLGAALLGGIAATAATPHVYPSPASQSLGLGNFFFGLGAGLVALAVAWLNLSPMHTRREIAIISVAIMAATASAVLGMSAASNAIPQVLAAPESQSLGAGNFALGLGLSLTLGGLVLGWYSRRH